MDERTSEVDRLQKGLGDANLLLASVATDLMGLTGRLILQELLASQTDPANAGCPGPRTLA